MSRVLLQCNHNGCTPPANVSRPTARPYRWLQRPVILGTGTTRIVDGRRCCRRGHWGIVACASTFIAAVLIAGLVRNAPFAPATFYGRLYVAGMYITFILARDVVNTIRTGVYDGTP